MELGLIKTIFLILLLVIIVMVAIKLIKVIWKFSLVILLVMVATIVVLDYQGTIDVRGEIANFTKSTTKQVTAKANDTIKKTTNEYLENVKQQLTKTEK